MELIDEFDTITSNINEFSIDNDHKSCLCRTSVRTGSDDFARVIKPFAIKPSLQDRETRCASPNNLYTNDFRCSDAPQKAPGNSQDIFSKSFPALLCALSEHWGELSENHKCHIISVLNFQTLPHLLELAKTFSVPLIDLDEETAESFEAQYDFFQDLATRTQHFIALH